MYLLGVVSIASSRRIPDPVLVRTLVLRIAGAGLAGAEGAHSEAD